MHNKLKSFLLIFFLFVFSVKNSFAQKKMTYGLGVDIFQTKLNNVDRESLSDYGHSVPYFTQNDRLGLGINAMVRMPIYKGLGLETGLGLARYQSQFHFEYRHAFSQLWMDKKFNIGLNYLRMPLNLYYNFKISPKSSILISGGVNFKLLLWVEDNFEKIMFEEVLIAKKYRRYEPYIFASHASIAYQYKSNKNTFEISFNIGKDFNAMAKNKPGFLENFGFYKNLHDATYSQYGISLKYLFTK